MAQITHIRKLLNASTRTRIVRNRRWIAVRDLEIGMYVCALDRPWSETRFLFQGFRLDSQQLLAQVQDACERVQVETEKLAGVPSEGRQRMRLLGAVHR